jgi:hypothetical protein
VDQQGQQAVIAGNHRILAKKLLAQEQLDAAAADIPGAQPANLELAVIKVHHSIPPLIALHVSVSASITRASAALRARV